MFLLLLLPLLAGWLADPPASTRAVIMVTEIPGLFFVCSRTTTAMRRRRRGARRTGE